MNLTKLFSYLISALLIFVLLEGCGPKTTGKFVESEASFETQDSTIAGILTVPEGKGPFPTVIILAGSGAFDRNGDLDARVAEALKGAGQPMIALNSTYRDIAWELSKAGMVTLRYDKRGIGKSTGEGGDYPEPSLRDLQSAVAFLRSNPSINPKRIALVGHSLGGLWALMEAAEDSDITAICVMATPAKPYSEVIIDQIQGLLKLQGKNESEIATVVEQQKAGYARLRSGELDPATLPEAQRTQLEFLKAIMDIAGADYAKKIKSPALILQGEKDLFTTIPEESQLLKQAFEQGGNKKVKLVTFADLDHMFRPTPDQPSLQLYYQDRGPISANVVETIVEWMQSTLG